MTRAYDSTTKRAELIRAAKELFHQQGFHKTTLDNVAKKASVPLGNVHYYFETKQALAEAVIASHSQGLREAFAFWESSTDPLERLTHLIRAPLGAVESVIRFGCPHGSLCQELEKLEDDSPLIKAGASLLLAYIDWAHNQLQLLGFHNETARDLAEQLVAAIQGTMLLAHTLRSPELLARQLSRVEAWLKFEVASLQRSPA